VAVTTPKLRVPLQLVGGRFATVEQGSAEEVAACVYAVVATPRGSRVEEVDFGIEDPDFRPIPLDVSEWIEQIRIWEPRASVTTSQEIEDTLDRINVQVAA
jgi:phage baseplate assembly protein W